MITPAQILASLSEMVIATSLDDGVRVTTHCLYPSNGAVSVVVRGGHHEFVVSDDRGALHELSSIGNGVPSPDRLMGRFVKNRGLIIKAGSIQSPRIPLEALPAGILLVANAAKECVEWGVSNIKTSKPRVFRKDLEDLLSRHFSLELKKDEHISGSSNKLHKFGHVVYLSGNRKLIIDPVINDPGSINARVVANLDVKTSGNPFIQQLIVYDDRVRWSSADLKLLEVGAPTVPFSRAEAEIMRRAA